MLGRLRLPKSEYDNYQMRDVVNAIIGYNDHLMEEMKIYYNVERFGQLVNINTRGNLKRQMKTQDFAFEWDQDKPKRPKTKEEWDQIFEQADRIFEMGHKSESWEKKGKENFIKTRGKRLWQAE